MEKRVHAPKIGGGVQIITPKGTENLTHNGVLPEALMAYAESVVGNAQAKVSATSDLAMKEYGNGCSSSITISLTCNQDDATINNVAQTLGKWTQSLAKQNFDEAWNEFQQAKAAKGVK
jgi:hypothetical protein